MSLRAGVVGAGVFGGYHAGKYVEAEGADLVAIFDPIIEAAKAGGAKQGGAAQGVHAYADYAKFLDAVDILTIAAPASYHFELAEQALRANKHVLIEKPIALALDQADRLIALADENARILQIGHQERYVFEAFGILSREDVPKEVHSRRLNKFSGRAMDVSVVFDLMIHDLDLLAQVVPTAVKDVSACGKFVHGREADHVETTLTFESDVKAVLSASRLEEEPIRDMRLVYEDGEIHIDFLKRAVTNTTKTPLAFDFQDENPPPAFRDPLGFGTQQFIISVLTEKPPIVSGSHGRAALDLALRVEQAAKENKP